MNPTDMIHHPPHYNRGVIEPWDFILDQQLGFLEGNILKYVVRYRQKNGVEDLLKARAYLDRLIQEVARATPSTHPSRP